MSMQEKEKLKIFIKMKRPNLDGQDGELRTQRGNSEFYGRRIFLSTFDKIDNLVHIFLE